MCLVSLPYDLDALDDKSLKALNAACLETLEMRIPGLARDLKTATIDFNNIGKLTNDHLKIISDMCLSVIEERDCLIQYGYD